MGDEKDFETEIRERMTRMETMLQMMAGACPSCQARITALEVAHAEMSSSSKSAHHRLDSIKTDVAILVSIIGLVFTALNFVIHR